MSERFSDALTRAMAPLRRRLGMSHAMAGADDPFSDSFNAQACCRHLADLRAAHATLWPSAPAETLAEEIRRGDADRLRPPPGCAQSLLPSFGNMCADFA